MGQDLGELRLPEERPDIRLVVSDMDGTLLDGNHALPPDFAVVLDQLAERGITFAIASGRHRLSLQGQLPESSNLLLIASNGAHVVKGEEVLVLHCLPRDLALAVAARIRQVGHARAIVTTTTTAYTEDADEEFLGWMRAVLPEIHTVADLGAMPEDCLLSVGIFDHLSVEEHSLPALGELRDQLNVMATTPFWIDVVSPEADKGVAVRLVQRELGVGPEQTAAFGDFLNDLGMLDAATYSFAMANGHPEVRRRAAWRAPANTENGVMTVLRALLDLPPGPLPTAPGMP